ncbi:MAG TPA: PQQ-binding-like beta-propeller repeat protein [Tepidisphaeraceae bacterium]|nr:PQQ-binding-like beta-propeller repeat protein [Tepidisphaeraceae bacterium]
MNRLHLATALKAIIAIVVLAQISHVAHADAPPVPVKHRVLLVAYDHGNSRLMEVSADGKLEWEHKLPSLTVMFQRLPNGNIVYAHSGTPTGATEIDRDGKVVWDYKSDAKELLGCERLPNGNTLLGEGGPCRAVEVNSKGEVVSSINLKSAAAPHNQVRRLHQLANGHILVAHEGDSAVREYDRDGKVVWEYKGVENVFEAVRLKSGNTLIAGGTQKRLIEVSPEGKIVWELKADDVPELNLQWITSLQVLANGNYVVANFLRGHEGQGAHAFEITHDKKVVWKFADHAMVKSLTMLQVLD